MVYFFYGPDRYTRRQKRLGVVAAAQEKYPGIAVDSFYLDEEGAVERLHEFAFSRSLFGTAKKIAVVYESLSPLSWDAFSAFVSRAATDSDVLVICDYESSSQKLFKKHASVIVAPRVVITYFPAPQGDKALILAKKECGRLGIAIEDGALRFLGGFFSNDISLIISEAQKLSLAFSPVTRTVIQTLPEYQSSFSLFDFSKSILFSASVDQRLVAWERLLVQKPDFYGVLNYLAKAANAKVLVQKIARADIAIKAGRLEPEQALTALLLS